MRNTNVLSAEPFGKLYDELAVSRANDREMPDRHKQTVDQNHVRHAYGGDRKFFDESVNYRGMRLVRGVCRVTGMVVFIPIHPPHADSDSVLAVDIVEDRSLGIHVVVLKPDR